MLQRSGVWARCSLLLAFWLAGCGDASNPQQHIAATSSGQATRPAAVTSAANGQTGWYWNAAEGGTGFFFEEQGGNGFAGFFMYEEGTGKAVWYVASGPYVAGAGNTGTFSGTLMRYSGGQAAASTLYTTPVSTSAGTVQITFGGASNATVQFPGRVMNATRFNFGGPLTSTAADRPETGWYWNATQGGRGYALEVQGTQAFMAMFHYNADGSPTWHIVLGDLASGLLSAPFNAYTHGQSLSGAYKNPGSPVAAGTYSLNFSDPCAGFMQLTGAPAVSVRRFALGGLAAGAECRTTANPRQLNNNTSYWHQNKVEPTDMGTLLSNLGIFNQYYDARVFVDLDGDGISEVVMAAAPDIVAATPVRIFQKQSSGGYSDATASFFSGAVASQIHPRKVIAADFNGDGRPDLFFLDHGYDHPPFPGAQNVLALSDAATGKLALKAIAGLPTVFSHCGSAADIDNNGTVDIFACGDGYQSQGNNSKDAYFLLNDGSGNMTVSRDGIPVSMRQTGGMVTAELLDIDGDGYIDLFTGGHIYNQTLRADENRTMIFWGDGSGRFTDAASTRLPSNAAFPRVYDFKAEDIDGDGRRELILLTVSQALQGYYIHVFKETAARQYADESLTRIIKNAATWEGNTGSWFPWLRLADVNGDGRLDIVVGDSSAHRPARNIRWINDGTGAFYRQ